MLEQVSPSWLAGKDLPASPGMGSHKDDESSSKGDHGALCHPAAAVNGSPPRLQGQVLRTGSGYGSDWYANSTRGSWGPGLEHVYQ